MKQFVARINFRQILVYTIAFWFFMHSFETLSYLLHLKTIQATRATPANMEEMQKLNGIGPVEITSLLIESGFSAIVGLVIAFIIGIIISRKKHWLWLNTLISFISIIFMIRTNLTGWDYLKPVLYYPGRLFENLFIEFLLNGVLLLIIGLLLFFLKPINRFISGKPKTI